MDKFNILIVEDDYPSRLVLEKVLSKYGKIYSAEDGKKGLDIYKKHIDKPLFFDLFVFDIMLPNIDGFELLDLIRKNENNKKLPRTFTIFLSALDDINTIRKVYSLNCELFKSIILLLMNDHAVCSADRYKSKSVKVVLSSTILRNLLSKNSL